MQLIDHPISRKGYTHNLAEEQKVIAQLTALVNLESTVKEVDIDAPPTAQMNDSGQALRLVHKGRIFQGRVDRPLMHQIGARIWPEAREYSDVARRWQEAFETDKVQLESAIADSFTRYDLKLRYIEQGGANQIYGIVSPHFREVNQLAFREAFLQEARRSTALVAKTKRLGRTRFGHIIEFFHFDSPGFQVGFDYGLVYARNTGYDAYKVDWGRLVLVCTNGLTLWEDHNRSKWHHNHRVDLSVFLSRTVAEGIGNQQFLENRIRLSRDTELLPDATDELLSRLSLATATKLRLAKQLEEESRVVGANEWALSQALTYLGTHDRHMSFNTKRQLTELGTDILERSLTEVLAKDAAVGRDGTYGLLLPSSMRHH